MSRYTVCLRSALVVFALGLFGVACSAPTVGEPVKPPPPASHRMGSVTLRLVDAPSNVAALEVTVQEVAARFCEGEELSLDPADLPAGQGPGYPPQGWVEVPIQPKTVDLLSLVGGVFETLAQAVDLPAATYCELRLVLAADARAVLKNGTEENLQVPSGASSGYKIKGQFRAAPELTTTITLDFDVEQSLKQAGQGNKYVLQPVVFIKDVVYTESPFPSHTDTHTIAETAAAPDGTSIELWVPKAAEQDDSPAYAGMSITPSVPTGDTSGFAGLPFVPFGNVFDLGPDGRVFSTPIQLQVQWDPQVLSAEQAAVVEVFTGNRVTGSWEVLPVVERSVAERRVVVSVSHFSPFVGALPRQHWDYAPASAIAYATTYYDAPYSNTGPSSAPLLNPFTDYSQVSGGNCANFGSQSIVAGLIGVSDIEKVFEHRIDFTADRGGGGYEWYFISDADRGPAWTGATKLREYADHNKPTYMGLHFEFVTNDTLTAFMDYKKVQVGDIIFADFGSEDDPADGSVDHTMIVTRVNTDIFPPSSERGYNRIRLTYQTNNRTDIGLGDMNIASNYQSLFYVYRPKSYSTIGQ